MERPAGIEPVGLSLCRGASFVELDDDDHFPGSNEGVAPPGPAVGMEIPCRRRIVLAVLHRLDDDFIFRLVLTGFAHLKVDSDLPDDLEIASDVP